MHRNISYSEISTALSCTAQWDFQYGGRLAGSTLKPKQTAALLSEGSAWGEAVATWHQNAGTLTATLAAHDALQESLDRNAFEMADQGFEMSTEDRMEVGDRLAAMLDHYAATAEPLPNLTRIEDEVVVPILSRAGTGRASGKYRFHAFIDGLTVIDGRPLLVEFKLRRRLQSAEIIQIAPQIRWYSWALSKQKRQQQPVGVLVDERLNAVPKPARILKSGKASHAKDQLTTVEQYHAACLETGEQPVPETTEALALRRWQQRVPIMFRQGELDEAADELVTAGRLIRDLDYGQLRPIRNASPMRCGGCRFKEICANPMDVFAVEAAYERGVPKRDRGLDQKKEQVA